MMAGTGVLRPECAAVLVKPTTANCATATTEAQYQAASSASPTDANFFNIASPANTAAVHTWLQGAGSGGVPAAKARHGLRCNFGSNFSREVLNTAAAAFPYA
jgi:hypothetical protein